MQIFMKAKRHEDLYQDLTDYLPKLFNFEKAGIMFMDHTTGFLYSINENEDGADPSKHEEISRYPINMGLTGICLAEREPLITLEGEDDPRFSFEVDNILRLLDVESLLIVPLIDSQNRLQGAIQMINKLDADEIPKEDVVELLQICPSIAEVLTFCELAKDV
jgi:transcriptional regulator with GAF, ATPase, and Fis domain